MEPFSLEPQHDTNSTNIRMNRCDHPRAWDAGAERSDPITPWRKHLMRTTYQAVATALVTIGLLASGVAAHKRDYVAASGPISPSCVNAAPAGVGGAVGALLDQLVGHLDPKLPDFGGTCYGANHIVPDANGDVTFFAVDQVVVAVGLCVAQDADGDGTLCDDDDVHATGCGSVTVNGAQWRFGNQPGAPGRVTWVLVDSLPNGIAALGMSKCGGMDSWGTTGFIDHT